MPVLLKSELAWHTTWSALRAKDQPRPGKSIGLIDALDCATQVFGIGRHPSSLSVNKALERAQREQGGRYLNNMAIDQENMNIFMYNRTCIVVKGEGFR